MMKIAITAFLAMFLGVDAATRVAVIDLGMPGAVRRTTTAAGQEETSADGVASFLSALHGHGRKLQHAGMPVVPDLFSRPESGVMLSLTGSGLDLDRMPALHSIMRNIDEQDDSRVVGHMQVSGNQCQKMLDSVPEKRNESPSDSLKVAFEAHALEAGLSGVKFGVTSANVGSIDDQLALLLEGFSSSQRVVLHLCIEEEDGSARRRQLSLNLDGKEERGAKGSSTTQRRLGSEDEEGNEQGNNNDQANNNGYYGYGYFNAYGEWVTPYKTMFQIQYFNVVLWTSLGLVAVLFFSIYLMIYMPLMADTLLFGESARVAHDD